MKNSGMLIWNERMFFVVCAHFTSHTNNVQKQGKFNPEQSRFRMAECKGVTPWIPDPLSGFTINWHRLGVSFSLSLVRIPLKWRDIRKSRDCNFRWQSSAHNTFVSKIKQFSVGQYTLRVLRVEMSYSVCVYRDQFEPATTWLINYTAKYARMISVGTPRIVTFHT